MNSAERSSGLTARLEKRLHNEGGSEGSFRDRRHWENTQGSNCAWRHRQRALVGELPSVSGTVGKWELCIVGQL